MVRNKPFSADGRLNAQADFRCNASAATACTKQRSTHTVNTNLRGYRKPHAALVIVTEGHTFFTYRGAYIDGRRRKRGWRGRHKTSDTDGARAREDRGRGGRWRDGRHSQVTVFIRDMRLYDEIHEVRRRYFKEPYPTSSMVEVSALIDPRLLIEIEAVAVIE